MIEMGKQYKTSAGNNVRIYATDAGGSFPIHGAIELGDEKWFVAKWKSDGKYSTDPDACDLVEVKPKRTLDVWVNVYRGGTVTINESREDADLYSSTTRIACLHIVREYEEGEGL